MLVRFAPFLALTILACPLSAQTIQVSKDNKTIAITATDTAASEPDTADISIGYTLYGNTQDQTYADASRVSNRIVNALTASGMKPTQIRSTEQSLNPVDPNDKPRYDKGIRFVATQSWTLTTKASAAAEALHLAITSGANNSGNIDWRLADDSPLEAEAARKALAHAQQVAASMAEGLHIKLGPLVYASNQLPERQLRPMAAMAGSSSNG